MTFIMVKRTAFFLPIILSIFLTACGGGGGGTSSTGTPTTSASASTSTSGGTITSGTYVLSWNQVADPSVTGYKVYYANGPFSSGAPLHTVDVGASLTYQFNASALGLPAGATVYLAISAVGNGMESPLSNPVSMVLQ